MCCTALRKRQARRASKTKRLLLHVTKRWFRNGVKNEPIEIFGIKASYLVGFRSVDEIRNRLTKAKKKSISEYVQKEFQAA